MVCDLFLTYLIIMSYIAWTDGGNEAGNTNAVCAAVISDKNSYRVIGKFVGDGTNNVAELYAVKMVLEDYINIYGDVSCPPIIYSDSQYCVGLLTKRSDIRHNVKIFKDKYDESKKWGDNYINRKKVWNLIPNNNVELVEEIRVLVVRTNASLVWVRGHAGCSENILADRAVQVCKVIKKNYSRSAGQVSELLRTLSYDIKALELNIPILD